MPERNNIPEPFPHLYNAVCLLAAIYAAAPPGGWEIIPAKWKEIVVGVLGAAMWIKAAMDNRRNERTATTATEQHRSGDHGP